MRAALLGVAMIALAGQAPPPSTPVKPGNGISEPRLISSKDAPYSSEAMLAGVQGSVELEIVVLPTGAVGDVRVVKPLHPAQDKLAMAAAKQWRFQPGRDRSGAAIPVLVTIIMDFRIDGGPPPIQLRAPLPTSLDTEFLRGARLLNAPGLTAPVPLRIVPIDYTDRATLLKIEGDVDVDFVIEADGTVTRARIPKPFDTKFGMDERVIAAVLKWTFKPAQQAGENVAVAASVTIPLRVKK